MGPRGEPCEKQVGRDAFAIRQVPGRRLYSDLPGNALPGCARQTFHYQAEPRAGGAEFSYADADPAPRMASPDHAALRRMSSNQVGTSSQRPLGPRVSDHRRDDQFARDTRLTSSNRFLRPAIATEPVAPGQPLDPFADELPPGGPVDGDFGTYDQYDDRGQPLEPEVMNEPFLQSPHNEYFPEGYCTGGDYCDGNYCLLRRWWQHVTCLRRHGAYCENFHVYFGKQGFRGPVDQGVNGDFGYHGGGNWAMPLLEARGIGYQIGLNYLGSDFAGRSGPLGHRRAQLFATTGVFRRALCGTGFQGGAVLDYLHDDYYVTMDLTQVRAEISYQYHYHEVGFWGAFQGNTSNEWGQIPGQARQLYSFQANSQYNIFYRYEMPNGTVARTWAGMTAYGDGIFGSDTTVRISNKMGLMASYNFLVPRSDPNVSNNTKEAWNVTFSVVWYPGYNRCDSWKNPYRPLFYTANNGWFFVRQAN